jgi:hypothetical protein
VGVRGVKASKRSRVKGQNLNSDVSGTQVVRINVVKDKMSNVVDFEG